MEAYIRLVWLFAAIGFALAVLLLCLYVSMRKARKRETRQLAMSEEAIAAQEAERLRIYMELHDAILPRIDDRALSAQIREICASLMPPDFARLSFGDSLAALCTAFIRKTAIPCDFDIPADMDFSALGEQCRLHIYRIAQEAFNNIAKHSQAKRATFAIRRGAEGSILMFVSDEGAGLGPESAKNRGFGISAMCQRAAIIGAKLDIFDQSSTDQEGGGCVVRLEIPPAIQRSAHD
jgi:two-component system NarL family sensor kinase